ncbi:hypothetical protein L3Y34_017932 [Caenorhabditis briggsae]|uniref:P53 and DNA damage-regulated protein 1 n=1 Tax=Caenorhabditis briggsae TaxID=6238 RepID=A0AAE9DKB8_CAEBR|nr:hypothetical protein L3Y34_017932 [Caenorhabditis briggsae]
MALNHLHQTLRHFGFSSSTFLKFCYKRSIFCLEHLRITLLNTKMLVNINSGMAMKTTTTPHDPAKELRDRTTEIMYLSAKLNHAKETCVSLDNERQKYREVTRQIKEKDIDPVWVFNGTCFLQTSQANSLKILEQDTKTVEDFRGTVEKVIKQDTDTFLKLHKQRSLEQRGFDLKPLLRDGKLTD